MRDTTCLLIGGNWDEVKGRTSIYIEQLYNILSKYIKPANITYYNGGNIDTLFSTLRKLSNDEKSYDMVISYANYDINKYGHLNLREYFKHSIITIYRKNHNHPISKFQNYISYSKSDFLVEIQSTDEGYSTRLLNSNGIIISKFYISIDKLITRLINESDKKRLVPKVTLRYDLNYETTKEDLSVLQNSFEYLKNNSDLSIANLSVRIPKRYLVLDGKKIYIDSRIVSTGSTWNQNKHIIRKNLSITYKDERYSNVIKYGNCKPSTDSLMYETIYSLFDDVNYIIKSNEYYKESTYLDKIPVMRSVELSRDIATLLIENKKVKVVSIIGQGSFIFLDDLTKLPSLTKDEPRIELLPKYYHPKIKSKDDISLNGSYVSPDMYLEKEFDDFYSLINRKVVSETDKIRII